jgi:hypothetical protein
LVPAVHSWKTKSIRIKTAPRPGDRAPGIQPFIVGAGETIGGCVAILVVGDNSQVGAEGQGMVSTRPGHVVNEVVHRHVEYG